MAIAIPMLALSPTMSEGIIAVWKFKEGDMVPRGAVLCEVETDKAVMDYESPNQGVLLKIVAEQGKSVKVGDLIAVIGQSGEDISSILTQAQAQQSSTGAHVTAVEGTLQQSEAVNQAAPAALGPDLGLEPGGALSLSPHLAPGVPPTSPLARRLAKQAGIDLRTVQGTGPGGRIVKRDVERSLAVLSQVIGSTHDSGSSGTTPTPPIAQEQRVPVSRLRQIIADRLSLSMREAPHFFVRMAIDMERIIALRTALNKERTDGFSISYNAIIMKLTASLLLRHQKINSTWTGDAIVYHPQADIALAVALEDGLVAPVVRNCEKKGIEQIELELRTLIAKAREGKLQPQDYEGATFTISNLGAWGVEEFTAIINPPGSAILALGAIRKEATVLTDSQGQDRIEIRHIMHSTLSADHRTIDGAVAAAFMKDFASFCEDPARALM
ncbi:MAG: dihydrolipoamide acetyltransferase family protein [Termitinemataceae bacterium]